MWKKTYDFLKKEASKTKDVAIEPITGPAVGFSFLSLALIALVCVGMAFAVVKIIKIAKKKQKRTD